jgi:hypothetical protein
MNEQETRESIARQIEALIIKSQAYEWNEERIGGLELALDIVWGKQ